jgi:tRNA(fMet)-specific endonuclease VapC
VIYLLDTNICIQLWQRNHLTARRHFMRHKPAEIALCSVVKAELMYGALHSAKPEHNTALLEQLFAPLKSYEFNDIAATHYAQIRESLTKQGKLIGANDLLIAAIARANALTLVTHNTAEFERVEGLQLTDWEI